MFATMFEAEQRASLHQGKDAPYSGATKGTMPSSFFTNFFKKISTIVSRPMARAKGFLTETQFAKSKDDGLRGMTGRYSFKAPSAYVPVATA
jgi:hypothetical protein